LMWVVSLTHCPPTLPLERNPWYSLHMWLGGPQSQPCMFWRAEESLASAMIQTACCLAHSTVPTVL
jgi:hypothetical protein